MTDLFGDRSAGFPDFWAKCPVKKGKAQAEKAWRKLGHASRQTAAQQVAAFYERWQKEYPTASPLHPSTYLNGRRWEDYEEGAVASDEDWEKLIRDMLKSQTPSVREQAYTLARKRKIEV